MFVFSQWELGTTMQFFLYDPYALNCRMLALHWLFANGVSMMRQTIF